MSDFDVIGKIVIDDQGNATITGMETALAGLADAAAPATGGISLLGFAFGTALGTLATQAVSKLTAAFTGMLSSMVTGSDQLERTINSINATIISTGDASGISGAQLEALAQKYRDLYGGSNLAVLGVESVLARFKNINESAYPKAIQLTADIAAKMGPDAASAAQLLGRALEEPGVSALRVAQQLGVVFLPAQLKAIKAMTEAGDVAGAQQVLMQALAGTVGGQAAAAADTMGGKWAILQGHISSAADEIGLHFQPFIEHLLDVVTPIMDGLLSVFERDITPIIDNASAWGEAIVDEFAQGMQGAEQLVVDVINQIGSLIADLMAPGSPPKFLPLLDVWGREAVDVYLKGWTTFDKTVFDEIGKAIQAGLPSAEISAYAQSEHALYDANQAVADAQDHLNAVTAQYDALLNPLNEKMKALTNQQNALVDQQKIASLQLVEGSSFYSDSQRKQAAIEIEKIKLQEQIDTVDLQKQKATDSAKVTLTAAQQHQKDIQEETALLKNQIDIQAEQTKHINEAANAATKLHNALKGAAASLAGLGGSIGGAMDAAKSKIDKTVQDIRDNITGKVHDIEKTLDQWKQQVADIFSPTGIFAPVGNALRLVKSLWDQHHTEVTAAIKTWWENTTLYFIGHFAYLRDVVVQPGLEGIKKFWQQHSDSITTINTAFWNQVIVQSSGSLALLKALWEITLAAIKNQFDTWWPVLAQEWNDLWNIIGHGIDTFANFLQGDWRAMWQNIVDMGVGAGNLVVDTLNGVMQGILSSITAGVNAAIDLLNKIPGTHIAHVGGVFWQPIQNVPPEVLAAAAGLPQWVQLALSTGAAGSSSVVNNTNTGGSHSVTQNIYSAAPGAGLDATNALLRALLGI